MTSVVVDESTPTPEELQTLVTGTELYRGWRLDLLSYRLPSGWRPFVLIKGPGVSLTSDLPCLLSGTFPSKGEADRRAFHAAKGWLEKHFGASAPPRPEPLYLGAESATFGE